MPRQRPAAPRRPGRAPLPLSPFSVPGFVRLAGLVLLYAALHLVFALLPLTIPLGGGVDFNVRPGVLVPLLAGLLLGPGVGLGVGALGRLLADGLTGTPTLAGVLYSGLLGLSVGLAGRRPEDDGRTLRTLGRVALWVLLSCAAAAVPAALWPAPPADPTATLPPFGIRLFSEFLSGAISALLLLPAALVLFVRRAHSR